MKYFHLTTPQRNIWNLQKYYNDTAIANLCGAIFFPERRDGELLCQAVRQFIRNQSGIRLRFSEGEEPGQYISDEADEDISVKVFRTRKEFDIYAEGCARNPIGLSDRRMYRFVVFHLEQEDRSGILPVLSHLVSDAWTFGLMANQLDAAYRKLAGEKDVSLLEGDYADFIRLEEEYLTSERYGKDKRYWEEKYLVRPEECPVKLRVSSAGSVEAGRITRSLPFSLEQGIQTYCKNHPVTEAVLFETALVIYLSRINSDLQTVTVGVPVLNRSNAKEKEIAGMFVSTMPLTVTVTGNTEIAELTKQITKGHMDLFRHQRYPYAEILRQLREKWDFSGNLYDVMISYQNARTKTRADTKWYSNGFSEVPLAIHIDNRDGKACHTINVDFRTAVFRDEAEVKLLIDRLEYILGQIVEESVRCVGEVGIVPPEEYDRIVYKFNDTYVDYPRDKCVHELFMEQAARTPDKVALVFEGREFTYRQLDEMSNSLAHFLRGKGVKPNDVVPIIARRSWHVVVAMLGVLKAGAAYMPVAPDYPSDRIEFMLSEIQPEFILTYGYTRENRYKKFDLVDVDYSENVNDLENKNTSEDICYILYTSGSAGLPKAVCIRHRNMANFNANNVYNSYQYVMVKKCSVVLANTEYIFDISSFEIFLPLLNGLCIIMAKEIMNAGYLAGVIDKYHVDALHITPTKLLVLIQNSSYQKAMAQLKVLMVGAEVFTENLFRKISKYTQADIYNGYGPTEITIGCSFKKVTGTDITIGKPIANTQIYILNSDLNPVPIGVPGELCIAGEGVGKGYLNRPELTAEKFVPNPFVTEENRHGKIMYRTGDLACFRSDGEIEYLGRIDTQVKIRGLRIELGEIESVMGSMEGIGLVAAADKRDENGRQYLVGYYTSEEAVDERKLRGLLGAKLPRYMVPNYFMRLEAMPMTASGKTDRRNLPVPNFGQQVAEYAAPETDTERRLAAIWQEFLKVDRVGRTDDFFELGGDSLLAISMLSEIERSFHVGISVREIMEQSELSRLAACVENARPAERIAARHAAKYILLPQQKAIYAACMKEPESLFYNMPARIPLPGGIDRNRLKESIAGVLGRHRILKSCVRMEGAELCGVYEENAQIVFEEHERGEEDGFVRPFDLGKAPLVRVGFTQDALLVDMHHIIADGDSMNIILRDIASVYKGEALRELQAEYSDYAAYFYSLDTEEYKAYFRETLKGGAEPAELPQTAAPEQGGDSRIYPVPRKLMEKAREYGRQNGLTDTMVFMGAYGILLAGYTGKREVLSSIILQNRTHADTRDMVGMFVNTLPVRLSVEGRTAEYMGEVKKSLLGLFRCQELPFEDIAEAAGLDKSAVNTAFVYQGDGDKTLVLEGQELIPQPLYTHAAKFDLSLELTPTKDGGRLRLEYRLEKYDEQLMDDLADAYLRILGQLDRERIADITILSDAERRRIVEEFNDTYVDYPRDKCVHELFMEQAARTPDKVALVFEGREFTYRQLDEMSNSLAHFLRGKGVKPNDVVPIIARRSWHVVVAMLGILKAGGGYMLADLSYPDSRINYMIQELDAKVVLTLGYKVESRVEVNEIDLELFKYDKKTTVLSNINHVDDILAIIFTSGTTGMPKGTALCHKGAVNFTYANDALYANCNYIVGLATVTFDAFFLDTICPIIRGIPCILTDESEQYNSDKFGMLVSQYKYVNMFCTPTKLLKLLMACKDARIFENISSFCIGGEVFSTDLYKLIKKFNRGINVYNVYGPTETTMWTSAKRVYELSDITIGKPIANTQIYILNSDLNPVPIGVPGELCIAGEGVGKGYLNRPELTAEKFVPNPFATEENRHGKVMYRTGDLARFRSDGEIEYLGRIDTQVKIRGLRIELGEIESVMGSMEGIGLVAAADKRDENGRQYLVGYYTSEEAVDERELRSLLGAKLPRYMVPNYFMRLEAMPMTASGKTDRRNLPVPDFGQQTGEYVAPVTGRERELCRLMEELLHVERVGVTDDFFELGGDSLTAIEFLAKARDRGIDFSLQNVFDYPTVEQLCRHMEEGEEAKVSYAPSDFDRYRELLERNVAEADFVPRKKPLGNVLLTGATGFLGAHVLDRLLREETGKVYCLVRAGEEKISSCRERLREILRYYFGDRYEAEFAAGQAGNQTASGERYVSRIIPVAGDIESEVMAENMPENVNTVIHTAASVKHYGSYGYFHRVNVEGTKHVVNYARSVGARLIHISTLSVSGNSLGDDFTVYRSEEEKHFGETSLYIGQPLDNVYVHSKFEAERVVFDAMLGGLDARVIRVGNLTSRASDYRFQPNYRQNAFLTRVKAILEFGLFPDYLMPLYCEFSPIDLTAEGVVKIAQYADRQTVFHLNSNRPVYFDRFLEVVRELGISMKVVDGDTFNRALRGTVRDRVTEYIFEAFQNDMDGQGRLLYDSNIRIDNDFTVWFLNKLGFAWNEIDREYIRGYVEYFREIGYLTV